MGSPHRICNLILDWPQQPDLPNREWQDIWAQDPNGRFLALIGWDIQDNDPGFRIYVIDRETMSVKESPRFRGCCEQIAWSGSGFRCSIFGFVSIPNTPRG
jgi:hypothetical protein